MIETSMVLYEHSEEQKYMVSITKGTAGAVEFDFDAVWNFKKMLQQFDPKKLIWLHVHPPGFGVEASAQDYLCAKSLQIAFKELGKFGIFQFRTPSTSDCQGQVGWHELDGSALRLVNTEAIDDLTFLKGPAMVLKLHSFVQRIGLN
jgi:hypothetical protein